MECEHKRLKCTNNVFYCMDCGAVVPNPYEVNQHKEVQEEKPAETKIKPSKRKGKKEAE